MQLIAQAHIVPQPALNALGQALQDIIVNQDGAGESKAAVAWTQPSVLNWPPQQEPVELWAGEGTRRDAEPVLLHSWFEQRAEDSAQLVALDFLTDLETGARTQFTYRQVSNAANSLAVQLCQLAASPRAALGAVQAVAVLMGPCPELYISYLAALKAGLAFCPIPVDAPGERQTAMLADLQPVIVLIHGQTSMDTSELTQLAVDVSPFLAACDTEATSQISHSSTSDTDAAYVLYTSGTTGLPKGVIVSHRSAACTVSALSQHYGFPDSRAKRQWRWFQGAAPTFDISLFEIFWTLSTGSTLCCAPRHLTMQNIDEVISVLQADITNVTPSFASLINPSTLRGLMVGGETLNTRLLKDFAHHSMYKNDNDALPWGIYNGYGPTEVAIYSLAQPHVPVNQRGSVIGAPLATCGVLIVSGEQNDLMPVPQGAVGELVLTGPQVSTAGYLNRPEETRKAFVDDGRWGRAYRTGDRARIVWTENGEPVVEFLGRLSDAQVKLSGRRVELGEIENVLATKTRGVQQVLACVWKRQTSDNDSTFLGSERVVCLVVVDHKSGLDFATVSANCAESAQQYLPDYMRPFRILEVDKVPRSASGKANRKAASEYAHKLLQEQTADGRMLSQGQSAESLLEDANDAQVEAELVNILSSIVGENAPGHPNSGPVLTATTKFAAAGVDSLRAMRLLREIRCQQVGANGNLSQKRNLQPSLDMLLDPDASIRSVFFAPIATAVHRKQTAARQRVDGFAARHKAASLERLCTTYGPLTDNDVEMVLPMTSTASQLAVSFAMDHRNYISNTVLPLRADVSTSAMESAVRAVFNRHAAYRSALVPCSDDMSPFSQVVLTPAAWQRCIAGHPRVVRTHGETLASEIQSWLDVAQQELDFDLQQLYYVQLIEPEDAKDTNGHNGLLIISIAHCLCDGASLELLLEDISREYTGLESPTRLSVLDAVSDWAAHVTAETDRHWQVCLQDWEADSFQSLSGDSVKASADHKHALAEFSSSMSWTALEAKSRSMGASPLSILQAAWSLLLKVWSEANTEDIVFGSVLSGQHEAGHALTFSVVPCRVPLPESQTVRTLLNTLIEGARFAQSHRHISFGLFGALPYNTALALQAYGTGVSEAEMEENAPWTAVHRPAIRYDFDIFSEVLPQADALQFRVTYRADVLSDTSAQVIVHQFAALTETLLAAQPGDLAQGLLAHLPHDLLSVEGTIPVPTDDPVELERERKERVDVLHAQFENQAAVTPDKLALSFYTSLDTPPTDLTYGELDARANGLANVLRLEDTDVIPICMHRSVELYVSILAILKAGSAWSPIDETSPVQRRTSLIARTQGRVLLTTTDSFTLVEPCLAHESLAGMRVIFVDQYAEHMTAVRPMPRDSITSSLGTITGRDLAYLLWTSGTTGEPKGVMVQHYAAANAMHDLQLRVEHDEPAGPVRTLQLSAYSFDVFVQDLFFTWGLEGSVISGTRELILGTFTDFVNTAQPTHAHLTPSFGASIDVGEIAGSTLRFVTFIGEKLTEEVAEAWAAPQITTKAYNTYGPAENAVVSTMRQFFGKSRDRAKASNVGFPLTSCTAYVVQEVLASADSAGAAKQWELVPRYGVGELALGGAQVAKGYLNNEAKTNKAFIQGNACIGERIYLTGDMVRLNDHGFEFLGRNDDLVKITGIRIELSEISAACALVKEDEPAVEHVETLYLPRPGGDANHKVIVSFVSIKEASNSCVDTAQLRHKIFQKAREVLPAYMVPGHVAVLDSTMPRTASNKVDRKSLQAIYGSADLDILAGTCGGSGQHQGGEPRAQWRDEQLPVVKAVAENLTEPRNSPNTLYPDDSLAGHGFGSLQVTKLAWALRKQLGCAVRVLDLMRCQTVGELVDVVLASTTSAEAEKSTVATVTTPTRTTTSEIDAPATWVSALRHELTQCLHGTSRPANTEYILPATPVQEALLVETMTEPGAYWSHRLFDLAGLGLIDASRLQAAWTTAAARLDILRTVFVPLSHLSPRGTNSANGADWARSQGVHANVLQLVLKDNILAWTELSGRDASVDGLASHARKTQTNLPPLGGDSTRPPWALAYVPASKTLMLSMHHALYDGESSRVLIDIVARLYNNPAADTRGDCLPMSRGLELGLLPSVAQRDEASAVWAKHLHRLVEADGAVNARFPDLTCSRHPQEHAILSAKATIPSHFLAHAADRPDLPRLLQSAFGCVLAAILELKTIVLGQTVSQRILHPDLARVVGPAMATLPVVIRAHAESALDLWAEMGRDTASLSAQAHHLHPVDIKKMANEGSGDPHAPFPALFVYHPAADKDGDHTDVCAFREVGQALPLHVEHPMALNIFEAGRTMELTGDARRISQPMLDLMLAQVLDQARTMLAYPDVPLPHLNNYMDRTLVSVVGEPRTLVGAKIARNPAYLVTKQAVEHPHWVAIEEIVLDDDDCITATSVTYSKLEILVNAITAQLAALSVAVPGDVVAVYLERDTKSLAAILAIFKLNYVYLPIDGDLPAARKQLLVCDANAKLIVTTESLVGDLELGPESESKTAPCVFLLPEGSDELDIIQSWSSLASTPPLQPDAAGSGAGGYLLYTSGSTGRPKGVRVANESLLHFVAAMTQRLTEANPEIGHLGGVGKFLNVASRAFDTHLTTMFAPWHLGFCSAIGKDRNGIFANLQQVINEVGITNMGTVPSVLLQLGLRLSDVPSIRVLTFGGEKASKELFDQLGASGGDGDNSRAALMNFYGPTEAAVGCMSHVIGHHSNARNLGLPLPGLEAFLLVSESDGNNGGEQIVARRGQPGEFCIAGPQVAVGYLDRPDENAQSFQYTTLLSVDGTMKRFYRTGDIMRMMHDGTVEFLGRRDQQTKIRGQRFEIGEVEAHIKKAIADQGMLDVAAAVVDQRLVGLVARKHNALFKAERESPAELLSSPSQACRGVLSVAAQACERDLPAFMVPEMVWLSKMPFLAVSGKLDTKHIIKLVRDADNAVEVDSQVAGVSAIALSSSILTESEKEVLAALEEVLGGLEVSTVNTSSSIRSMGIDSLSGVHLLAVLKRRGFTNVVLADLLSPSGSIQSLCQKLNTSVALHRNGYLASAADIPPHVADSPRAKELTLSDLGPSASNIQPIDIAAIFPCLPLQSSLVALSLNWLHDGAEGEEATADGRDVPYVTQFNYQLAPSTDIAIWRQAAELVVASEAVLRTCFVQRDQDGQIFQVVLASPPSPFARLISNDDDAATLVSRLSSRPPLRLSVQQDGRASLLIHHALYDGAAIAALRLKIEQAYLDITSGTPTRLCSDDSLASLRSLAHHCDLSGQQMQSAKAAWENKLHGISPCRVDRQSGQPNEHAALAPTRSTRRLAYTAADLKARLQLQPGGAGRLVSVSTAFQLATLLLIANLTAGSPSIVYGYTTSLRSLLPHIAEKMDNFIGPCLNTVVHALLLQDGGETLPHLAARVAQNHADVSEGIMPLVTADKVQRWAGIDEKLFDSLLTINFVSGSTEAASASGIMRPLPGRAKIDLALTIDVDLHQDGRIELLLASARALNEAQLESAGRLFEKVVENAANSDATVGQFVSVDRNESILNSISNTTRNSSSSFEQHPPAEGFKSALSSVRSLACQLLGLTETAVPADTSLYRLGLDSINVLSFVKLLNKSEDIKVNPSAVIRARTLQGVAALVHAAKSKGKSQKVTKAKGVAHEAEAEAGPDYERTLQQLASDLLFVATPLQEGMLSASLALADQAYTYTHTMQLSAAALQQDAPEFTHFFAAVQDTVLVCEILRTRFIFTDHSQAPWVGIVSPTDQSDLVSWRVSSSGVIQLRIHHALYDASSIQAMWHLLCKNYVDRLSGVDGRRVQRRPYLFRPFARQVAVAQRSAIAFWVNTLQDYHYTPVALGDGGVQQYASSSFHFSLDVATRDALQTTCREANVALKTAMQLAWTKVLCETLYKQADIVFGEVITTSSDDADSDSNEAVIMGPTINTIPMRLQLAYPSTLETPLNIADALSQLQELGDQARGPSGMASLRDVQTAWRSSRADGTDTAAGIFQSLFVFDGDTSVRTTTATDDQIPIVPVDADLQVTPEGGGKAPLYDDYPLIVSFRIRDGVLHGALRAKVGEDEVHHLGTLLTAALHYVASSSLQAVALNPAAAARFPFLAAPVADKTHNGASHDNGIDSDIGMNESTELADSVLQLAKQAVGSRIRGKVGYATKLVNIGLDSITAIRFANLLKNRLGIHVSVFDIIKGASVESIVRKLASAGKHAERHGLQTHQLIQDEALTKHFAAEKLGLQSTEQIKSVLPVLTGQRHTLQHWLHSGKRFFEAPWVYRVVDGTSIDAVTAASVWKALCRAHDILQTTFVALDSKNIPDLVQVTLHASDSAAARFTAVRDDTVTIQQLVERHVRETNNIPSDLRAPPSRLSFLEAAHGQAFVLRVHHALYDAWSIKMILNDLASLFSGGPSPQPHQSLQFAMNQVARFRNSEAEHAYWEQHLADSQDTVLQPATSPPDAEVAAPMGFHFRASYPDVLSLDAPLVTGTTTNTSVVNKTQTSAVIIAAYAHALGQLTGRVRPTFGLNYASRSLSSADGNQTLELTGVSLPTMTVAPMSVNLEGQQPPIDAVSEHLAELTKFAQADHLHKLAARYNTHINILFTDADKDTQTTSSMERFEVLQRHRLGEPLASEYFTKIVPLATASSTVDSMDISWLPREQLYFNVLVRNGSVSVDVSGDEDLLGDDTDLISNFVDSFAGSLAMMTK